MTIPDSPHAADIAEALERLHQTAEDIHQVLMGQPSLWSPTEHFLGLATAQLHNAMVSGDVALRASKPRPIGYRKGDWIQTFTGRRFWPLDPRAEDVSPADLAHHLAGKNRFNAATKNYYSVASHSVAVMRMAMVKAAAEGLSAQEQLDVGAVALLHDTDEAYLPDVPRPIKPYIPGWMSFERTVRLVVHERFDLAGVSYQAQMITKECDEHALALEVAAFDLNRDGNWTYTGIWPDDPDVARMGEVKVTSPEEAEAEFLAALRQVLPSDILKEREPLAEPEIDLHDADQVAELFLSLPPPERVTEQGLALATRLARLVAGPVDVEQPGMPVTDTQPKGSWMTEAQTSALDPRVERNKRRLAEGK